MLRLDSRLTRVLLVALEAGASYADALRVVAGAAGERGRGDLARELLAASERLGRDPGLRPALSLAPAIAGELIATSPTESRSEAAKHILRALPRPKASARLLNLVALLQLSWIPIGLSVLAIMTIFVSPVFEKMYRYAGTLAEAPSIPADFSRAALLLGMVLLLVAVAFREHSMTPRLSSSHAVAEALHWLEAARAAGWSAMDATTKLSSAVKSGMLRTVADSVRRSGLGAESSIEELWELIARAAGEPKLAPALLAVSGEVGPSRAVEKVSAYLKARPVAVRTPVFLYAAVSVSALGMLVMVVAYYRAIFLLPASFIEGWPR